MNYVLKWGTNPGWSWEEIKTFDKIFKGNDFIILYYIRLQTKFVSKRWVEVNRII